MTTPNHRWVDGRKEGVLPLVSCSQPVSTEFLDIYSQAKPTELFTPWSYWPYSLDTNVDYHSIGAARNLLELSASSSSSMPEIPSQPPKRKRSGDSEAGEDNDTDEASQNRTRRRAKTPSNRHQNGWRLACPYQVYDKSQVCFSPSAQNPLGGCAGVGRLRQHLRRRHMPSVRCKRCWRSFDTLQQRKDHETAHPLCDARESPPTEAMMGGLQEHEFESLRMSGPEETSWWKLFQLLIPGMNERDISWLKMEYWPYYVKSDSFTMPAMTFSNTGLPPSQTPASLHSLHSIPASSTPSIPDAPPSESAGSADTTLRRNHDRLKKRQTVMQRENAELRDAAQQVYSGLDQLDTALEEVLNDEGLPVHCYDKVVEISSMIASLKTKAR